MNGNKSIFVSKLIACAAALMVLTPSAMATTSKPVDTPEAVITAKAATVIETPPPSQKTVEEQNVLGEADPKFKSIFASWTQMDNVTVGKISIPSRKPVDHVRLTSDFGNRSDPFSGRRKRHNGIDIAGPRGTPIYATADGVIGRAKWVSGYGRYVEINHGNAIQTRYGHMSRINVKASQHVNRGDIIGYIGSTGRSTGNHLHYEVRIDGKPVNPMPFLQSYEYLLAAKTRQGVALGGPAD